MLFRHFPVRHAIAAALVPGAVLLAAPAHAYRPFDLTDADTLAAGRLQIKGGPVNATASDTGGTTLAPNFSVSYGLAPGWELTAGGKVGVPLDEATPVRVTGLELAAKSLLREGSLNGAEGPSLATEVAALLPGLAGADPGFGVGALGVASWRLGEAAAHLNALGEFTRGGAIEGKAGLILEGPDSWVVRPALEGGAKAGFGTWSGTPALGAAVAPLEYFGLVGAIWRVDRNVSLDVAGRLGWSATGRSATVRGGFAWKL